MPHHQSELLEAALKQAGVPVTFYTVKGAGHGGFKDPRVPELTREFLAKYLKPAKEQTQESRLCPPAGTGQDLHPHRRSQLPALGG